MKRSVKISIDSNSSYRVITRQADADDVNDNGIKDSEDLIKVAHVKQTYCLQMNKKSHSIKESLSAIFQVFHLNMIQHHCNIPKLIEILDLLSFGNDHSLNVCCSQIQIVLNMFVIKYII